MNATLVETGEFKICQESKLGREAIARAWRNRFGLTCEEASFLVGELARAVMISTGDFSRSMGK